MPNPDPESIPASQGQAHHPGVVWGLILLAILVTPLWVMAQGYLPGGEALRLSAHVADGRAWGDVLVLGSNVPGNHQAAWEVLLRGVHTLTGWGARGMLTFSVCSLFVAVVLAPAIRSRAPEAWITAWLLLWVSGPSPRRVLLGSPFLFVEACFLALMAMGSRPGGRRWVRAAVAVLLFMTAGLVHESWYLLAVVPLAFLLTGRFAVGRDYLLAWLAGTVLAALVSGHPGMLWAQISRMNWVSYAVVDPTLPNLDMNSPTPFVAVMIAVGWLTQGARRDSESLFKDPLLLCVLVFWLLGFWFQVLWLDWAFPGGVLWMALRLEPFLARLEERSPIRRVQATAFLCLSLGLLVTVDHAGRWSDSGKGELRKATGESREWYPQPGGILYARDGQAFTFGYFLNPDAPWRYMVGFDPAQMTPRDRAIYGSILAKPKSTQAILPWVAAMRPEDRICIQGGNPSPGDLGLEWHRESSNLWLGRLPRK